MNVPIPLTIITGFLGSGKTTVLNHVLRQPELAGALVIVNEFGEIGLDHLLIEVSEEQFILLDNGCICCTVRGDLAATLKEIERKYRSDELSDLRHVLIETTGLADPAPILHTLLTDSDLANAFRINCVVATIDAVNGVSTLARHPEAAKQIAVADLLLITKTDLVASGASEDLRDLLDHLAPSAKRLRICGGAVDADELIGSDLHTPRDSASEILHWFETAAQKAETSAHHAHGDRCEPGCTHGHRHAVEHSHGIRSYSFVIDQPIEWPAFAQWLDYVGALKGEDLLRMKGMVCVADAPDQPLIVHGVQHVFHPPIRLAGWPSEDHRTRLVFIVRNIAREAIERTLVKFAAIDAERIARPALNAHMS